MKIIQLKIFRDIAYTKSFVEAARINFITQPSVSIHLKKLENELGAKLFDRVPKKVVLTQEGAFYLLYAEEILEKCANLLAMPKNTKDRVKGEIRIASIHSIGMYGLGPFLKQFMQEYPQVQIHLEYQNAYNIYELIQKRKIHIGMVAYPKKYFKTETTLYGKDQLGLIVPRSHPLYKRQQINIQEIMNEPFVAFDLNTPTREKIDLFLKKNKILVKIKMINNNIFALKKAVEAGIGISIVPWNTAEDEEAKGTLRRIKIINAKIYRPLALLTPRDNSPGKIEEIFKKSLISYHQENEHLIQGF